MLQKRLSKRGFEVSTAGSGSEAIIALRARHFDVAVLGLKMKDMDGTEVLKIFKKMDPSLAVIMLTGHGSDKAARDGMALGRLITSPSPARLNCSAGGLPNLIVKKTERPRIPDAMTYCPVATGIWRKREKEVVKMNFFSKLGHFMMAGARAHAKWELEVSRTILGDRKRLVILGLLLLPIIRGEIAFADQAAKAAGKELPQVLGGKKAYSPASYTTAIFIASMLIGLVAGLITGCIGAGGGPMACLLYARAAPGRG